MVSDPISDAFVIHSGMDIVYADPVFCTLVGADSPEDLVGRSLTDLVTMEYRAELRDQVARIEREDAPALGLAVDLQTAADRSQRGVLLSSLIEWEGTQKVQTTLFPIAGADSPTGRLLRDEAMDEAPIGITISDPSQPNNPLIYVNDGFCELTGYSREEIIGQNCRFLQGEATREEPVTQMRAAIDAEEPVTVDLRNYRKDGSLFWNRVTIVPIRSESGSVTNYLGYQQDVTGEKRFEQDLSLFKETAEGSEMAVMITDPQGTIEYVNPAFEEKTGYTATEAIGRTPRILKSGQQDDEFYENLWDQITAGEVWEAELTNQTKHGELYDIKQKIIPVTDKYGDISHFVAIEQDITERELKTQALDVLNRVLRHNLRNALNAIEGHAELLEEGKLDPDARQASITAIRNQAATLEKIAEKTAKIRMVWDPTDGQERWDRLDLGTLVETYRTRYPDAEITARMDDEAIRIQNAELFELALDEAVENVITHAEQSPPEVTITVDRELETDHVSVSVADTGPGLPEIERQVLDAGTETPLSHSHGVGLWLMEWVATTLGGELTIEDNEPRGTVVTFHLPVADHRAE